MDLYGTKSWPDRFRSTAVAVAISTFGILALELALIRWTSSQIRIFAYFSNIILISAFLLLERRASRRETGKILAP